MNIVRVPPPFGTNMQSQNEFHWQTNSLFARDLHWTSGVTLNPGKRRWVTAWIWMNPDCNWDDYFWVKSTSNFLQCSVLCFPMSSSSVCYGLKMLQVCMTILTRLMTTFLKHLKNGDLNLNPVDGTLAWPLSEIHFKCMSLPIYQTGDSEAKFTHLDIKTAENVSVMLTENCPKCCLLSVYLACYW